VLETLWSGSYENIPPTSSLIHSLTGMFAHHGFPSPLPGQALPDTPRATGRAGRDNMRMPDIDRLDLLCGSSSLLLARRDGRVLPEWLKTRSLCSGLRESASRTLLNRAESLWSGKRREKGALTGQADWTGKAWKDCLPGSCCCAPRGTALRLYRKRRPSRDDRDVARPRARRLDGTPGLRLQRRVWR
jgi:hypothetical protein